MGCTKTWWFAAALVCAGCGGDDSEDTGAGPTDGSATESESTSTATDASVTDADATIDDDGGSTSSTDATTTTGPDTDTTGEETTGVDSTTAATDDETTSHGVCDVIGEGCHDNKTPEGINCHLVGHEGDEAACMEIFEMCVEICGL
jgi:hypothetical protein